MKSIHRLLAALAAIITTSAFSAGDQPHALPPLIQPSPTYPAAPLLVAVPRESDFQPQPAEC